MMTTSLVFAGTMPLLLFVAKATVLLVAAFVATIPLRRGTAGSRHLLWLAALVGVLALPLLSRVSVLRLGVLPRSLSLGAGREQASPLAPTPAASIRPNFAPAIAAASVPAVAPRTPRASDDESLTPAPAVATVAAPDISIASMLSTVAIIWSVVALGLLGWLAFGTIS